MVVITCPADGKQDQLSSSGPGSCMQIIASIYHYVSAYLSNCGDDVRGGSWSSVRVVIGRLRAGDVCWTDDNDPFEEAFACVVVRHVTVEAALAHCHSVKEILNTKYTRCCSCYEGVVGQAARLCAGRIAVNPIPDGACHRA